MGTYRDIDLFGGGKCEFEVFAVIMVLDRVILEKIWSVTID